MSIMFSIWRNKSTHSLTYLLTEEAPVVMGGLIGEETPEVTSVGMCVCEGMIFYQHQLSEFYR